MKNQGNLATVFPSFKRIGDDLIEQLSIDMPNVNLGPFQFRKDITTSVMLNFIKISSRNSN